MKFRFIKTPEKRKIIEELEKQFGIKELNYLLIETGKEKYRGFTGHLSKEEIAKIDSIARIQFMGVYLIRKEDNLRLSFDATQILKEQITKNIIEINKEEYEKWIRGYDLEIQKESGTYVIKYEDDFIGCAKSNTKKLLNHTPKERRIKSRL